MTQHRKSLSLCVRLYGFSRIFTEWHLRRLQTHSSTVFLKQGPEIGPLVRAISRARNHLAGPVFFVTFSQNVHKIYARSEALMSIPNVLTQEPSRPPRGAICPAVSVTEKQKSLAELLGNLFNFVNENITPTYQTPGIFIGDPIMKIPGVWYVGAMFSFTKLNNFMYPKTSFCPWANSDIASDRHAYHRSSSRGTRESWKLYPKNTMDFWKFTKTSHIIIIIVQGFFINVKLIIK